MKLPFADGFNQSRSLPAMNRKCTNVYPKFIEDGDTVLKRLFGVPGQLQLATTGTSGTQANRGSIEMDGIPYFVNGTVLSRLNADFTISTLGTVLGSGKVSMAQNGVQVMVLAPGGNGYIFNKDTAVFAQITDGDFTANGAPQIVIFIDGYFMCSTTQKKNIVSELNNGLAWNPLDFGTAESDPDPLVSLIKHRNEAFLLGSETLEGIQNIGGTDFPFARTGLFVDKGCSARFSPVSTADAFMWIGGGEKEEPRVWAFQGGGVVPISNSGVDELLSGLASTALDEVAGYTYTQDGSTFVAWELPNQTIVYGTDTRKWHLRQSQITDVAGNTSTKGWRSTALLRAYGKIIGFDTQDGRVGDLDLDFYDEYGGNILREWDVNAITAESVFVVPRIEVSMESGVGDATTPAPLIGMNLSRDGKTFAGERYRPIGGVGKFDQRTVWRANGRAKRYMLPRFNVSEKVKIVVTDVSAQIGVGRT